MSIPRIPPTPIATPRETLLGRLEEALDRPTTEAERALMLWLCPPSAELRRLSAASGLLATSWPGIDRAPGAEVGFLRLAGDACLAVSVDSRFHVDPGADADLTPGTAAAIAKLIAVGSLPVALHTVVHAGLPDGQRTRAALQASIQSLSRYAAAEGLATIGAELSFDHEYGDTFLVDCIAIGWGTAPATVPEGRGAEVGDRLVALSGPSLRRARAGIEESGISFVGLPTSSDVPLRAVIAALGELGIDLVEDAVDPAQPEAALKGARPDPTRSILALVPPDSIETLRRKAKRHGASVVTLGTVCQDPQISVGLRSGPARATVLPAVAVREPLTMPTDRAEPDDTAPGGELSLDALPEPADYEEALRSMLRAPNLSSRQALYERFDTFAGGNTVLHPGPGAGTSALRVPSSGEVVAVATSGSPRFTVLDPYVGFCIAVCEGVRRLAALGARPRALVGGTSFGAASDPELRQRAEQGLAGLRDAAQAFALPCLALTTSPAGPDESPRTPVTPGLAFLGTLERPPVTGWFKRAGDAIVLLGRSLEEVAGSEMAATLHGEFEGSPPWVDFQAERSLQSLLLRGARRPLLQSARVVGGGGLALAIVHACCGGPQGVPPLGARITLSQGMRPDAWLFAESQGRALVSVRREHIASLRELADDTQVPFAQIGEVSDGMLEFGELIDLPVDEVLDVWQGSLAGRLGGI